MKKTKISFRRDSDSFFTHLFARSVSIHLTPIIAKTKITPLQITIIGLLFGLCAAWIGSKSGFFCGFFAAFFMELSHVLDCVDGELARLTGRGNPFAASIDPISDRVKDMAVIYAGFAQSFEVKILGMSEFTIFSLTFFTFGLWFLYMYIVDAFLNPAIHKKNIKKNSNKTIIYLGLYDLFIYGSITLWLLQLFEYFVLFIFCISILGVFIQTVRLKNILLF